MWLLTNVSDNVYSENGPRLHAFWAEKLRTNAWNPHQCNPLVFSADHGRNGGVLKLGKDVYRVRQKYGFYNYGESSSIAKICRLDENVFEEETVAEISPHFITGLTGTHHVHYDGDMTVIDFSKEDRMRKGLQVKKDRISGISGLPIALNLIVKSQTSLYAMQISK